MIAVIAEVVVTAGAGEQFEAVVAELVTQVRENEPDNVLYKLVRSRTNPDHYRFIELYSDQVALESHGKSDHFRHASRLMAPFLAQAPQVGYFDAL
ncbi:antibiotic biosynthesis monooxygenase [Rhodococcus enclensis]|nr:antibiotic biosynthesis monooxygenase [Rhodococcus qingshengii]